MGKAMYAHQSDQLAERTVAEFCQTLKLGAVDEARVKVTQWLTWTGHFDTGPAWDITSMDALKQTRDAFEAEGISFRPWACPMGLDENGHTAVNSAGVEAEAQHLAAIANDCGHIELDIEPYIDFWPALVGGDTRAVGPLFSRLRELAPNAEIVVDLPFRVGQENDRLGALIELASPVVNEFYLQSYFGVAQAQGGEQRARQHTDKPVFHISDTGHLAEMLDFLEAGGVASVGVWVAQVMNGSLYQALASHGFGSPVPDPVDIPWQEPGFAALFQKQGAQMGPAIGPPYGDNFGNVYQESALGFAFWKKDYNAAYWQAKPSA